VPARPRDTESGPLYKIVGNDHNSQLTPKLMVARVIEHTDGYSDGRVVRYHLVCRELSSLAVRGVTLDMVVFGYVQLRLFRLIDMTCTLLPFFGTSTVL